MHKVKARMTGLLWLLAAGWIVWGSHADWARGVLLLMHVALGALYLTDEIRIRDAVRRLGRRLGIRMGEEEPPWEGLAHIESAVRVMRETTRKQSVRMAETMQQEAYVDPETGLGNRFYFDARLDVLLQPDLNTGSGAVVFVALDSEHFDDRGFSSVMKEAAVLLHNALSARPDAVLARRDREQFALLVYPVNKNELNTLCHRIENALRRLRLPTGVHVDSLFHMGACAFSTEDNRLDILSSADMALRTAQLKGISGWCRLDTEKPQVVRGMVAWRTLFEEVLATRRFGFLLQPVFDLQTGDERHVELFAELRTRDGSRVSASEFVPMAKACGFLTRLDRFIVDGVLKTLLFDKDAPARVCVNVAADSLLDEQFVLWLLERLAARPDLVDRLILEVAFQHWTQEATGLKQSLLRLGDAGVMLSLDHIGEVLAGLDALEQYPVRQWKLHQSLVSSLTVPDDNHAEVFVRALANLAAERNIIVAAEGIESEQTVQHLKELGVQLGQGHWLAHPERQEFMVLHPDS
jgi:RNase E specificity factor CsrD